MNTSLKVVLVFCAILGACAPKSENKPSVISRTARDPSNPINSGGVGPTTGTVQPAGRLWGAIFNGGDLTAAARALVSATMNPNDLGNVSGVQSDPSTGIRFWGEIRTNVPFSQAMQNAQINSQASKIRISIWDSFAAQNSEIPEYPISIDGASGGQVSGTVSGSAATLTFQDSYGRITLQGNIQGVGAQAVFTGVVSFQNSRIYSSDTQEQVQAQPASGTLGNFSVPACGFFVCQ